MKKKILTIMFMIIFISTNFITIANADDMDETDDNDIVSENIVEETGSETKQVPILNSRKCIIYDRTSKVVLYGKNENTKTPMASTTKIMTAIVVLENIDNLYKTVTITAKAAGTGGSRLGLKKDDTITINDLLYGLLMRSGNDAAVALAIEVGESVEGFAELMNNKASELGLTSTHFVTPHGLDDSEHYTTAFELAKLTDYVLENEKFASIVATKNCTITINGYSKALTNTNELLGNLNGVVGVKTGFTNGAGRCLVTETKRGDMDIITIVLGADTKKDRTRDSVKLISYAFSAFSKVNIKEKVEEEFENWKNINSKRIEIIKGRKSKIELKLGEQKLENILIKTEEIDLIKFDISTVITLEAPISKNTKIGTMSIKLNEEIIETIDILTVEDVKRKNWIDYYIENIGKCRTIFNVFFDGQTLTETKKSGKIMLTFQY